MLLNKEQIKTVSDLETQDIEVPEWGGTVRLKSLTGAERDRFEASVVQGQGRNTTVNMQNLRAKLVAQSAIGEDGKPLFTEEDVKWLGEKSAKALNRLFNAAQTLSGLSESDVKELAGNFKAARSEGSISA
ncbi:MAG TPA: hypothetical protein PLL10_07760 [Elusimicrobiales bacterium]|nr:hypothetical protein [Elusimicrobiales bacterium]